MALLIKIRFEYLIKFQNVIKKSNSFQYIWRGAYIRRDLMGLLVVVVVSGEVRKRQFFSKLK